MRQVRLKQRRQCGNKPECFSDFVFLQLVVLVLAGETAFPILVRYFSQLNLYDCFMYVCVYKCQLLQDVPLAI